MGARFDHEKLWWYYPEKREIENYRDFDSGGITKIWSPQFELENYDESIPTTMNVENRCIHIGFNWKKGPNSWYTAACDIPKFFMCMDDEQKKVKGYWN